MEYGRCKCMCKSARRTHGSEHFISSWSMISATSRRRLDSQTCPSPQPLPSLTLALHSFKTGMDSAERTGSLVDKHAQCKVPQRPRKHTRKTTAKIYIDFINVITPGHSKSHAANILTADNISKMKNAHSGKYSREQYDVEQTCTLPKNTAE